MLGIAEHQRHAVFCGRGGDDGIPRPHSRSEAVLLYLNQGPMTDVLCQGKDGKAEIVDKTTHQAMLVLVLSALEQFHIGLDREKTLLGLFHQIGSFDIAPLHPDEDVGIKKS